MLNINKVSETTVRLLMKRIGWTYRRRGKGVYVDGHEREDVVRDRKAYLERMAARKGRFDVLGLDEKPEAQEQKGDQEDLVEEEIKERPLVPICHDETTTYTNDHHQYCWASRVGSLFCSFFSRCKYSTPHLRMEGPCTRKGSAKP